MNFYKIYFLLLKNNFKFINFNNRIEGFIIIYYNRYNYRFFFDRIYLRGYIRLGNGPLMVHWDQ